MTKRPFKPEGFATMSPYLTVRDVKAAIGFYKTAFGFSLPYDPIVEGEELAHAEMTFNDATMMIGAEGAFGGKSMSPKSSSTLPAVSLYVYCEDVDSLFSQATKSGANVLMPPENMFWGDRMCKLQDPDGHEWCFATNVATHAEKPAHEHHGCC